MRKNIDMSYSKDYNARMLSVKQQLVNLGIELTKQGCDVLVTKDRTTHYLKCYKQGKHIHIGFSEVPYRWYASYTFKPSKKNGSGRTLEVRSYTGTNCKSLFTAEECIALMQDDWKEIDQNEINMEKIVLIE